MNRYSAYQRIMNIRIYIRTITRRAVCCGLLLSLLPGICTAQEAGDGVSGKPLTLYFRLDGTTVDKDYMDNRRTLRHLDELLSDSVLTARIDSVNILSFASPDGRYAYNERLAQKRSRALKGYLVWKYPHLDQYRIHPRPQGENWKELKRLIEADHNLPGRERVLAIIDSTDNPDRCKTLLKQLDGGSPYLYIREHFLHRLRNASVCMVWLRPDSLPALPAATPPDFDTLEAGTDRNTLTPYPQGGTPAASYLRRPLFAVKTNLLFDLALMPNVEVEVPIGERWSLNGELMFPWWLFDHDKYCLQILMGGLEGRYWLGSRESRMNREVLTGHFLGLYAGGGKYDLQWDRDGYQGEFFIAAGISYGYATKIARNLRLEFNIGIGLLRTNYEYYHTLDNYQTLLWQNNGRYTWLGPTKAKVSLVWMLNRKVKKGGGR